MTKFIKIQFFNTEESLLYYIRKWHNDFILFQCVFLFINLFIGSRLATPSSPGPAKRKVQQKLQQQQQQQQRTTSGSKLITPSTVSQRMTSTDTSLTSVPSAGNKYTNK